MIQSRTRPLAALFVFAAMLAGCGDAELPAGPEPVPQANAASGPDVSRLAVYSGGNTLTIGIGWKWIGPAGGSLRLADFEVIVPPGAVTTSTRISIRLDVAGQRKDHVMAEFGPHGQTFAVPVTLRLPYATTSAAGEESRILWWDEKQWVPFESVVTPDGRLETTTDHFSTYGTEGTQRGILVAGG
jgi:hypothetical protein